MPGFTCRAVAAPTVLALSTVTAAGPVRTRPPMTYVIDYSRTYLDSPEAIRAVCAAPPDVMHVGKSVPILHNWGPVPLISGENQYTGGPGHTLKREAIRLLSPAELAERIEVLKAYTQRWHQAGVGALIPYSSYHTIAGDHQTREGFWAFFDNWERYEKWLGPKPAADPFEWLMVDREGTFVPGACGGYSPAYYAPLHRYRVCPEHPEWRRYQTRLAELIAEAGYDGVFPDNSNPTNTCFCGHCREGFKTFVGDRSQRELSILEFEGDPANADLMAEDVPDELVRRYRIDTSCRYQRMVREAGRRVNPAFQVFPNVNSYATFMPLSEACDILMFESTYSPGCRFKGAPPLDPFVVIEVGDAAPEADPGSYLLEFADPRTFVELSARIEYPKRAAAGQPCELKVLVDKVGASNADGDWLEGAALALLDLETREEVSLPLAPAITVGGGEQRPRAKRPPMVLSTSWTPARAGRYKLHLAYTYTDEQHLDTTRELACRHALDLGAIYQTHIGQLLFTMHAQARTVLLDYECRKRGREPVQELGLAECAAFSNGSTIASRGEPRAKYARFFRRARHLYEGFEPYADVGLLYSYWGFNPGGMGLRTRPDITPSVDVSGQQRLVKVLMDRSMGQGNLAGLSELILCGHRLELSDEQIAAIKLFASRGKQLLVYRDDTTVNGVSVADVLGRVESWRPGSVGAFPLSEAASGYARGLRFSSFIHRERRRMTLHVVNYNVACGETPATVTEVADAKLAVPAPQGWTIGAVTAHDPDADEAESVPFKLGEGVLRLRLPRVRIYKVLELAGR